METEDEKLVRLSQEMMDVVAKLCSAEQVEDDQTAFTRDDLEIGVSAASLGLVSFIATIMVKDFVLGKYLQTLLTRALNERLPFMFASRMLDSYVRVPTMEPTNER